MMMQPEITWRNMRKIKDLRIMLKDFEPMVKDPKHLWNGRNIPNFPVTPREAWANLLICIVLREMHNRDIKLMTMEGDKGDGFIIDNDKKIIVPTEHVCALDIPKSEKLPSGERRVIDAINHKIAKGHKYARGKLLVVFFDGARKYFRSKIRESIFGKHNFEAVFCVGLLNGNDSGYSYSVTEFRDSFGNQSITHKVEINSDFTNWKVVKVMQ